MQGHARASTIMFAINLKMPHTRHNSFTQHAAPLHAQRTKLSFPRNHSIAAPLAGSRGLLSASSSSLQHRSRAHVHAAAQGTHHLSGCHSTALVSPRRASTRSKYLQHATQCMKYKRGGQGAGAVAAAPDAQLAQLQFAEVLGHVAGRSQRRCKRSRQILHCGLAAAIGRNIAISG